MNIEYKTISKTITGTFKIGNLTVVEVGTSKKEVEDKIKITIDFYRNKGYGY